MSSTAIHPVIGIAGRARAGKSTAAELLLRIGAGRYLYSFADPIRAMLKAGLDIDLDSPYWQMRKEDPLPDFGGHSPRSLMQLLGTEWGRELVAPDLWLTLASGALRRGGRGMIIADVRFDNEAAWVRAQGGVVLHIERGKAPPVRAHASEAGVQQLPGDLRIFNESSLDSLHVGLAKLFREAA
jgi:hypothetical protein